MKTLDQRIFQQSEQKHLFAKLLMYDMFKMWADLLKALKQAVSW